MLTAFCKYKICQDFDDFCYILLKVTKHISEKGLGLGLGPRPFTQGQGQGLTLEAKAKAKAWTLEAKAKAKAWTLEQGQGRRKVSSSVLEAKAKSSITQVCSIVIYLLKH